MADRDWTRPFDDPVPLPDGRQFVTLKDAGTYIMALPKAQQNAREWQVATEVLIMAAEGRGPLAHARIRQQTFMQVIATLPNSNDEFSIQEITTASRDLLAKAFNPSHATQMLAHLAEKGLIYRNRRGSYCFAVPLLADFIRRQSWDAATRRPLAS